MAWLDDPVRFFETLLVFTGIAAAIAAVLLAWGVAITATIVAHGAG